MPALVNAKRWANSVTHRLQTPAMMRWLHSLTLWAFAVAQPLFSVLSLNPLFWTAHQLISYAIIFCVLIISIILPTLWVIANEWLIKLNKPIGLLLYRSTQWILLTISLSYITHHVFRSWLTSDNLVIISLLLGSVGFWLLTRFRFVQCYLTYLSIAIVAFPLIFLFTPPTDAWIFWHPNHNIAQVTHLTKPPKPIPIVLIILDELPLTSLLTTHNTFDGKRFPNISQFAQTATWYPHTVSASAQTLFAVPAILSGQAPKEYKQANAFEYPVNLFTLLMAFYHLEITEPFSHLLPTNYHAYNQSLWQTSINIKNTLVDLPIVYAHQVVPTVFRASLPDITTTWHPTSEYDPEIVFQSFIATLHKHPPNTLYFLHVLLPHQPWQFLPSGKRYYPFRPSTFSEKDSSIIPNTNRSIAYQNYTRYVTQLRYTDSLLGKAFSKLKASGQWDNALIIVTADHGLSFITGTHPRKNPEQNFYYLMRIPLLIKYPHQRSQKIDTRSIESIDILPTVLGLLKMPLPPSIEGQSIFSTMPRKTRHSFFSYDESTRSTLAFFDNQQFNHFEQTQLRQTDFRFISPRYTSWVGQSIAAKPHAQPSTHIIASVDSKDQFTHITLNTSSSLPAMVLGQLHYTQSQKTPHFVALGLNNTIVSVTQAAALTPHESLAYFMIPEPFFRNGDNHLQLFSITPTGHLAPIRIR